MSYDLMVFEASAAPRNPAEFMAWYEEQTEWSEDHGYNDPAVSSEKLRAWFLDMIKTFPAMNGPHATKDYDDPKITDYCVGRVVIYGAFAWSLAQIAREHVVALAKQHGVGFFDASTTDGGVYFPDGDVFKAAPAVSGREKPPSKPWWKFW